MNYKEKRRGNGRIRLLKIQYVTLMLTMSNVAEFRLWKLWLRRRSLFGGK